VLRNMLLNMTSYNLCCAYTCMRLEHPGACVLVQAYVQISSFAG
jgi:hypothetical protein